ncbi:hypothetical protein, partial [Nostoc sp.]
MQSRLCPRFHHQSETFLRCLSNKQVIPGTSGLFTETPKAAMFSAALISASCSKPQCPHQINCGGVAPKFYLWGLAAGEFIRSQVSFWF